MPCDFSVLIKCLARSNFFSKICVTHLDLRNPLGVSEDAPEAPLNSVLLPNAAPKGISLCYVSGARGSVMFVSTEGNQR